MESIPVIYVNVFIILLPSCAADDRQITDLYWYQDRQCIKCQPGQYVVSPCKTPLEYSECKECEVGSYTYDGGAFNCAKCRDCQETHRQNKPGSCKSTQDTQCTCEDGKYWDTSICNECDPPKHIIRSGGDKADQCVYCENGKYYNHSFPDSPCVECMKCDVGMSLVQQCNYTHDTTCIPPATTPTPEETDKTDIIIACSIGGILAVLIIIVIILYLCKKKIYVTRPKWLQPTIDILSFSVGDVYLFSVGLPDVKKFNCVAKCNQIRLLTQSAEEYLATFINRYHRADHVKVTAQVFYDRLKVMQLNEVAEEMENNQDINPFLNLNNATTDENHQPEENDGLLTGIQSNDQTVHNNRSPISNASNLNNTTTDENIQPEENDGLQTGNQSNDLTVHNNQSPINNAANNAANTMYPSLSPGSESYLYGHYIPMADASSRRSGTSMIMCTEDHELSNHRTNRRDSDSVDAPRGLNQTNVKVGIKNKKDIAQTEVKELLSA